MSETQVQTEADIETPSGIVPAPSESSTPYKEVIEPIKPKRYIEVIGKKTGPNACEYCIEADKEFQEKRAIKENKVDYTFKDVETDEGEEALNEVHLSRRKGISMPVIKDCTQPTDPAEKPQCKVYQGYEPEDFYDLDNFDI